MNKLKLIVAALLASRKAFSEMSARVPEEVKPEFEKMAGTLDGSIKEIENAKDPTDDQVLALAEGAFAAQSEALSRLNGATASIALIATKALGELSAAKTSLNALPGEIDKVIVDRKLLTPAQADVLKTQAVTLALEKEREAVAAAGKRLANFNTAVPGAPAPNAEFLAGTDEEFAQRLVVAKANAEALTKRKVALGGPAGVLVFHSAEQFAKELAIVDAVAGSGSASGSGSGSGSGSAHPLRGCGPGSERSEETLGLVG